MIYWLQYMNKFAFRLSTVLQPMALVAAALLLAGLLLGFRLGSALPGYSEPEVSYINSTQDTQQLISEPLYAPHGLLQNALGNASESPVVMRLPSAVLGLVSIAAIYLVLRHWHRQRIAILTTLLFAASS